MFVREAEWCACNHVLPHEQSNKHAFFINLRVVGVAGYQSNPINLVELSLANKCEVDTMCYPSHVFGSAIGSLANKFTPFGTRFAPFGGCATCTGQRGDAQARSAACVMAAAGEGTHARRDLFVAPALESVKQAQKEPSTAAYLKSLQPGSYAAGHWRQNVT
eukprot:2770483-Pleurochrysis_carterae.AAC.1